MKGYEFMEGRPESSPALLLQHDVQGLFPNRRKRLRERSEGKISLMFIFLFVIVDFF